MQLSEALVEFAYSKDHSQESRRWYRYRLDAFTSWLAEQDVDHVEDITAPLLRRYPDYRRTAISRTGKPLDSHTLHGHARAVKTFLNWAVTEDLIDGKLPKKVMLPRRAVKAGGQGAPGPGHPPS
jgi:site-specific recombinase XerD